MEDRGFDGPLRSKAGLDTSRKSRRAVMVALILGTWIGALKPEALAGDPPPDRSQPRTKFGHKRRSIVTEGTLGYGPPGLRPGFPAFGLTYHPGYGYGGYGLGTMAEGGFPFYAGTGYPHSMPPLNRLGKLIPTTFFAGPGGPTPACPNFFAPSGAPLVVEPPAVLEDLGMGIGEGDDFGCYTGSLPYSETLFAPFATAAATGSLSGVPSASTGLPARDAVPLPPHDEPADPARVLGVSANPTSILGEPGGLMLSQVDPGSRAEKAGLRAGDVIRTINDRTASTREVLARSIAEAAGRSLKLRFRSSLDGQDREITILIP